MNVRRLVAPAVAVALTLTAAACSSDSDDSSDSGDTRTVTSSFTGKKVKIPKNPKRVLALWRTGTELADLGVKPVGALEAEFLDTELDPKTYAKYKDVPSVGSFQGVDVEKAIKAKPDLIVGMDNGGLKIDYDELSEVAPTVILKIAEPTDVWDNYPELANIVGKKTDFEKNNDRINKDLAKIKSEYGDELKDLNVTSFGSTEGKIWVDTSKSLAYRRLHAAGFGYNPTYTENPERYVTELSMEDLPSLAKSDAIIYSVSLDGKPTPDVKKVLDSASFKRLPAVKAGHVYPMLDGVVYTFHGADQHVRQLRAMAEDLAGS